MTIRPPVHPLPSLSNRQAVRFFLLLASLMAALLFPTVAQAGKYSTGWLINPSHKPVSVRFMLTGQINPQAQTVEGLLQVRLGKDWKTYWRTPGEGGIAPTINWSRSSNLKKVDWHWPVPRRYQVLGVETLGYKDTALFPMTLHLDDINQPVSLDGTLTLSSCTNICVLTDYRIRLDFTPNQLQPVPAAMHLYSQGISAIPKTVSQVRLEQAYWNPVTAHATLKLSYPGGWQEPDIFVDTSQDSLGSITFARPRITLNGQQLSATIKANSWLAPPNLQGQTLSLVVKDQNLAVALQAPLTSPPAGSPGLLVMLAVALLGGLILNIMPCVLPVLGLKLNSVINTQGLARRAIRRQFIASAAGIITSFWLLAGALVLLKLSGQAIGWGIQFQNPYFIGTMAAVTGLFAANMLGLFSIQLPAGVSTWLAARGSTHSNASHFIQGMFATLLATPCSAPFLGTAVAFALAAKPLTLWLIFSALALGMASPWLLVALYPGLARRLPRPGPWMARVRFILALMMLASSLWLLSLMVNFLGWPVIASTTAIALLALLGRLWQVGGIRPVAWVCSLLAVTLVALALFSSPGRTPVPADLTWQPLDRTLINQSLSQGKVVFVDITADWCITCKANKVGVLLQEPVYSRLQEDDIVRIRGDWTRPSQTVTDFLQSYGRFGVPFNIVYGPGAPEGISLPVILTRDAVIKAIDQARAAPLSAHN